MKDCEDHATAFAPRLHPEPHVGVEKGYLPEGKRGSAHPAHHTKGKFPSQLNPDHGPHK